MINWDEAELQRHIFDGIEEHSELDYKAAGSLDKQNDKTTEITKDVSAMANSAGGVIIYGIREFAKPKNHLPERLDPVDRIAFSKEWLEHIISTIQPPLDFKIIPVKLASGPNDVCYVVEIPPGRTVHQCRDHKYYRRYNFQSVSMADYEVRLVMNRATTPDVSLRFEHHQSGTMGQATNYELSPIIKNLGNQVVSNLKLVLKVSADLMHSFKVRSVNHSAVSTTDSEKKHVVSFQTTLVLFPEDERNLANETTWEYTILAENLMFLRRHEVPEDEAKIKWKLYADNMIPKSGECSLYEFRH